jgi:hypothetical protein
MKRVPAVLASVLLAACSSPPAPPPREVRIPSPAFVERVGTLGSAAAARAGAILYDGGAAIELPGGRSLWTFGDTFFGERGEPGDPGIERFLGPAGAGAGIRSIRGAVSHTAILSTRADYAGKDASAAHLGEHAPLIPLPPGEPDPESLRLWPMHGVHAHGRVHLFYAVVRVLKDAVPPFNFEVLGIGLAEGDPDRPPLVPVRGPLGWHVVAKDGPAYGAAVLQADMGITEGFDYIYGTKPDGLSNRVYVARVPHGDEAKPEAWRFGPSWSADPGDARPIFDDAPGDLSVTWNPRLKCFLAVHSLGLSRDVVARGSDRPEGPWSAPTLLFRLPPPATGEPGFVYAGKEQPGLREEDGRVLFVSAVDSREGVPGVWRVELESREIR